MSISQLIHDATQIICEGTCWVHCVLVGYLMGTCWVHWVLVGYILNEDFGEAPKSLNQAAATSCLYQFLHISTTKQGPSSSRSSFAHCLFKHPPKFPPWHPKHQPYLSFRVTFFGRRVITGKSTTFLCEF